MKIQFKYRIRTIKKPKKSKRFYPEYIAINLFGIDFDDWNNFLYKNDKKVYFKSKKKAEKFLDIEILNDTDYTISIQEYPQVIPINVTLE